MPIAVSCRPGEEKRKEERRREERRGREEKTKPPVGGAYADERRAGAAGRAEPEGPCLGWSVLRDIFVREEHRDRGVEGLRA